MRRVAVPLLFGLLGAAVLVSLGVWQMQRLAWKQAILADIELRIAGTSNALPVRIDPERDKYAPVAVVGNLAAPELHVLVGAKDLGAGYRLIQPVEIGTRRIMVDRGFIPLNAKDRPRSLGPVRLIGNLHWPQEVDGYTPSPDVEKGIWFARDVPAMAAALGTEPVLLVVRRQEGGAPAGITPLPVGSAGISNDHLQYAITWFSLAFIWLVMTGYLLWRMRRPGRENDVRSET
ncbi:SURF1 family protein [Roseovarius sp. M141]|uniref:SURF1 family protein n=1 Tax=Roseovarius sp. M141 TaxID=2583806 RepID=UPI0020CF0DC6|nr:SURF1 family protein [Roseovarius sp. M141]MCQ0092194.1 SURF1 family protein [Roseovarius sp. M141]